MPVRATSAQSWAWRSRTIAIRVPAQVVKSAALGGAAATYLADGDRPAQALSLEETMRRAPARDNADGHEMREPYRGHDIHPARRTGY